MLDSERQRLVRDRNRLIRIQDALKPIGERDELKARLDEFKDVVLLPDDFADRHRSARESLTRASTLAEQAEIDLKASVERLVEVAPPDNLLAEADVIETLHQRLGEFLKGQHDRPGLLRMQQSDEHFARDVLVELGRPRNLEEAESLRLRGDEPEVIREFGRRQAALDANLERFRHDIASQDARLKELNADLDAIGPDLDIEPLRRVVNRCLKLGDPEASLAISLNECQEKQRALLRDLARLPHWSGTIDELVRLTVPLDESIVEAARSMSGLEQNLARSDHDLAAVAVEINDLEAELRAQQLEREVPTEADLAQTRQRRDQGWISSAGPGSIKLTRPRTQIPLSPNFLRDGTSRTPLNKVLRMRMIRLIDFDARPTVWRWSPLAWPSKNDCSGGGTNFNARAGVEERLQQERSAWADQLDRQNLPQLPPEELRAWLERTRRTRRASG